MKASGSISFYHNCSRRLLTIIAPCSASSGQSSSATHARIQGMSGMLAATLTTSAILVATWW